MQRSPRPESEGDLDGDEFKDRKHALEIAIALANAHDFYGNLGFEKGQGGGSQGNKWWARQDSNLQPD
ncbi:MAG: hypothetical protein VW338_06385, partial [Rhodospirillaceae bacterium]